MWCATVQESQRSRRTVRAAGRIVGVAALSGLVWLLVHDLYVARPRSSQAIDLPRSPRDYQAVLQMSGVSFDQDRLMLTATIAGRAWRPWRQQSKDAATIWVSIGADLRALACDAAWGEEELVAAKHDLVTFTCGAVSVSAVVLADEVFYPFDAYRITLRPRICIDYGVDRGCTSQDRNVTVGRVELAVSDRTLEISPTIHDHDADRFHLSVRRRNFLRVVTGTFGVLATVFLFILSRLGKPEELVKGALGYFGTLWGLKALIVPSTVRVFPNVVDYTIFALFIVLFVILLLRWWGTSKEESHAQASQMAGGSGDTAVRPFE
jgi:hypothetical protein